MRAKQASNIPILTLEDHRQRRRIPCNNALFGDGLPSSQRRITPLGALVECYFSDTGVRSPVDRTQYRPQGARLKSHKPQRQRDQLIDARRHIRQSKTFEDRHVAGDAPLVR